MSVFQALVRRAIHNQQGLFGVKANLTLSGLISTSVWLEVKRPQRCISCSNSNSCVQLQRRSTICGFLKWMQDKSRRCSSRLQTSPLQIMSRPPSCRMISYLIINVEPFWMMVHLLCLQSHSWHEAKRLVGKEKHGRIMARKAGSGCNSYNKQIRHGGFCLRYKTPSISELKSYQKAWFRFFWKKVSAHSKEKKFCQMKWTSANKPNKSFLSCSVEFTRPLNSPPSRSELAY